jgi:hypothetical protein
MQGEFGKDVCDMDMLRKLPREVQVVLGGSLLYLLFSFFDWQQVSFFGAHAGITEWHGVGVIAGLLALALLAWEGARLLGLRIEFGPITPGLGSIALALLLLLFTVITFLTHNEARHWPAWAGLLLSIAITVAAFRRARGEGVDVRELGAITSGIVAQAKTSSSKEPTTAATPTSGSGEPAPPASSEPPSGDPPEASPQPET